MKNELTAKGLQSQINTLESEAALLQSKMDTLYKERGVKVKLIIDLRKKLKSMYVDKDVHISEHAILRYLERVEGIDMEEVKKKIMSDKVTDLMKVLGTTGTYPNGEFRLIVKNNTVVSVVND